MQTESLGKVYLSLCRTIDSPRSLACWILYSHGEFEQLVSLDIDPLQYREHADGSHIEAFRNDYLVTELLSKYKHFEIPGVDRAYVALSEFKESERLCGIVNDRIVECRKSGFPPDVDAVIYAAQRKISRLINDVGRPFSLDVIFDESQFGPGATLSLARACAYTDKKVTDLSISPRGAKYLNLDLHTSRLWNDICYSTGVNQIEYMHCNRVETVPKNAKKNRQIGIEPTYSMFYQKSIGNWLRDQLTFCNVHLRDQSRNQVLARIASQTGDLATVDLKAASNSIAIETIFELFPVDFANVLFDLRSTHYELDGEVHRYNMCSSMGNGYTFEVESAIFWALTTACIDLVSPKDRRFAIYGDDIIVSVECLPLLTKVLDFFGFALNKKKTHSLGFFRESCGKHYFHGSDVSPVYQKEDINVLEEAYRLANRLRRLAINRVAGTGSDGVLYSAWTAAVANVRRLERLLKVSFEVPINSELDGGLALPLSEMRGYAFVRFKHGDKIIRKKVLSRYRLYTRAHVFYVWNERRKSRPRGYQTYVAVHRHKGYKPENPFETSRLRGTFGPSLVAFYDDVLVDAPWLR